MKALLNWLDSRTGYKELMREALDEPVRGGARWRYVWGSTLVFAFVVQVLTGFALWMSYSPSSQTAWASVYYIQHEMFLGWLLRGIHHFMAQAMIVLLGLHLVQVVVDGAYRAPREINFWLGLILMKIVLALSLTGYLLPWDQKGYWATKVATSIAAITPVVGSEVQAIVVGGQEYGHHTLTRFFALHAGVLPTLLVAFLALHIYVFRKHGLTVTKPLYRPDATFWPDQILKDAVACMAVLIGVIGVMYYLRGFGPHGGAELGAPADPNDSYSAARPEWYFLFLFQFLKYFPRENEIYGAMVIPGLVMAALFIMPFTGKWSMGHKANIVFLFGVFAGIGYLTFEAVQEDRNNPDYAIAVKNAERNAERAIELVQKHGISTAGPNQLLLDDYFIQGPKLFAKHCGVCHRFDGTDGTVHVPAEKATASDLGKFGTREWLKGMITTPHEEAFFGATLNDKSLGDKFVKEGEMADWSKSNAKKMTEAELKGVVEFLIGFSGREDIDPQSFKEVPAGKKFFLEGSEAVSSGCISCHQWSNPAADIKAAAEAAGSSESGPDLNGYASREWLLKFINNPGHDTLYPDKNAMPAFETRLSDKEKSMLIDFLMHKPTKPRAEETAAETPAVAPAAPNH